MTSPDQSTPTETTTSPDQSTPTETTTSSDQSAPDAATSATPAALHVMSFNALFQTDSTTPEDPGHWPRRAPAIEARSEEHTSELQSRGQLVCRLLLEKRNTTRNIS